MSRLYVYVTAAGVLQGLLAYLLFTAPPSRHRRDAALFTTNLLLWLASEVVVALVQNARDAVWAIKGAYVVIALIPLSVHWLAAGFDEPRSERHRLGSCALLAFAVLTLLLLPTNLLIAGVRGDEWGFHRVAGSAFGVFEVGLFGGLALDMVLLVRGALRTPDAMQRRRSQYLLLAVGIATSLGVLDMAVLQPLGVRAYHMLVVPLGAMAGTGCVIYSIARTRLIDVSTALRRTVVYGALVAALLVPCLGLCLFAEQLTTGQIAFGPSLMTALVLCVAGFGFPRLRITAQDSLENALFGVRADRRHLLHALSREVTTVLDLTTLATITRETLAHALGEAEAMLWLRRADTFVALDAGRDLAPLGGPDLLGWADAASEMLITAEGGGRSVRGAAAALRARGVEVAFALRVKNRTVGILTLGARADRQPYTDDDLMLVVTLANQVSVALENARLYEELRESREQVSRATRLSAVGTLAAGVAHEIRNPLVAIRTFLQLLPERADDRQFLHEFGDLALGEVNRITRLITDLLTFARSHERKLAPVDLGEVATEVGRLLGPAAAKREVCVAVTCADPVSAVHGDPEQLRQVVLNVVLNAIEASPPAGRVTVRVGPVGGVRAAALVRLEVVDQGPGIAPEHLDALFTPFFTTKDGGTGLGLAVACQIATEHGGRLTASSAPGGGAMFRLELPTAVGDEVVRLSA